VSSGGLLLLDGVVQAVAIGELVQRGLDRRGLLVAVAAVRPGHDLDRLGQVTVPGRESQLVSIGSDHVREHVRVAQVAPGAQDRV